MRNYLQKSGNPFGLDLFGSVFDDFFTKSFWGEDRKIMNTDVKESIDSYTLSIDMPGYDKKDITINLSDGYLQISANRLEEEKEGENFIRRERSYKCSRSYYVGDINKEQIKAKYENGTLIITVPKEKEKQQEDKKIEIE